MLATSEVRVKLPWMQFERNDFARSCWIQHLRQLAWETGIDIYDVAWEDGTFLFKDAEQATAFSMTFARKPTEPSWMDYFRV